MRSRLQLAHKKHKRHKNFTCAFCVSLSLPPSGPMIIMKLELEHVTEILRRTPSTLNSLLRDLPGPWLVHNEGRETWSPYDIVGHLIHGEETDWIPRAKIILDHGEARSFEPFDRVAMFEESKGKSIAELLDTFAQLR